MRNISDVMTEDVYLVTPEQTIAEAALLMREKDVGSVAVQSDDKLIGMLTDRDLAIRAVAGGADPATTKVRELMTEDVTWCYEDQDVAKTAELMKRNDIRRIIVVDRDKRLVGVVALGDLARQQPGHSEDVLTDVSSAPPQK